MKDTVAATTPTMPPTASPISPAPAPSPTADERLAQALDHLGAEHGPRGQVLELPGASFAPGQARLKVKASGKTDLEQVVTVMHQYPKTELIIEGYTDNRGHEQRNNRLSLERAEAVQKALVAHGLSATRIRTRGLGSANPVADNSTRAGREKNRRVELVFSNAAGTFATAADQITAG